MLISAKPLESHSQAYSGHVSAMKRALMHTRGTFSSGQHRRTTPLPPRTTVSARSCPLPATQPPFQPPFSGKTHGAGDSGFCTKIAIYNRVIRHLNPEVQLLHTVTLMLTILAASEQPTNHCPIRIKFIN